MKTWPWTTIKVKFLGLALCLLWSNFREKQIKGKWNSCWSLCIHFLIFFNLCISCWKAKVANSLIMLTQDKLFYFKEERRGGERNPFADNTDNGEAPSPPPPSWWISHCKNPNKSWKLSPKKIEGGAKIKFWVKKSGKTKLRPLFPVVSDLHRLLNSATQKWLLDHYLFMQHSAAH